MNSRRQRYFRPNSPTRVMGVLEQDELVLEGDPDGQQVSHEEIVDDGREQMDHDVAHHDDQQSRYDGRQYQYSMPRRHPIRQNGRYMTSSGMEMNQKPLPKSVYQQRPTPSTRISPGGARIVSIPTHSRKRENESMMNNGMMVVKRMPSSSSSNRQMYQDNTRPIHHQNSQPPQQQQPPPQHQQRNDNRSSNSGSSDVRVVRIVSNINKESPQAAEQCLAEIEERIKQTAEDAKSDMEKIKELQDQEMTHQEYSNMLAVLLGEVDRLNAANVTLNDYYRQRSRFERTIAENREDALNARIRQLETENRKLRESLLLMHQARIDAYEQAMLVEHGQVQHEEHMGPIMEGEGEEVVMESVNKEVAPEWIVEETVNELHVHPDELDHTQAHDGGVTNIEEVSDMSRAGEEQKLEDGNNQQQYVHP